MDPIMVALAVALFIMIIITGVMAYKLHTGGTANKDIPVQLALKGGDLLDQLRDHVVKIMAEESARMASQATLRDVYFDAANFQQDVGRLPPSFTQAVTLKLVGKDEKAERDGTLPPLKYVEQANGNVVKVQA